MKKLNNDKARATGGSSQKRSKRMPENGNNAGELTNLYTISVPKRNLSTIKESMPASTKQNRRSSAARPVKTAVKAAPKAESKPKAQSSDKPRQRTVRQKEQRRSTPLKIIPLGGLNEIGKNMTVIECANDIFVIDCGLAFPDSDMLGVDLVLPDYTYLEKNADKIRGIVLTHGHEDHIGGLPYFLNKIDVPVYGTRLTIGLVEGKLKEAALLGKTKLSVVNPGDTIKLGCMAVEFIRVNHSIPDAVGMAIFTPAGILVHTGDFKVDFTPIEGGTIDLARFAELGNRGVLALMADSTNSERPGFTMSERTVGESFSKLFARADNKRIIIATFASNIHRVQQIIDRAVKDDRKVAVSGRSMVNVMQKGRELGYLKCPDNILIEIDEINNYPPEKLVIITTGSQGEPMSALTRMARNEHRQVTITPRDFIIISANPIPGNEKGVTNVVNSLMKLGADVIYESMYDVHVSGHACQEEQKLLLSLVKPKYFIPVHGEYKHLARHSQTAHETGIDYKNIIIADLGSVIETDGVDMSITGSVTAGKVLVDGLGVGDVGVIVLRDRKHLAQDGLIIAVATIDKQNRTVLAGPDIVSRGFVYVRESEELLDGARELLYDSLKDCLDHSVYEWSTMKGKMKDSLSNYIYQKTKRSPMILPIIMEV